MPNTTTPALLRDYIVSLIAAITPTINARDKFMAHHNEKDGDFLEWVTSHPESAFRRFQVRTKGNPPAPLVTNCDVVDEIITLEIMVAYPQTSRTGKGNALSRDDAADEDRRLINKVIGLSGYANFNGSNPNAAILEHTPERIEGKGFDYLHILQRMRIYRQVT